MELHTLKIFLAVVREKSFSRAAERVLRTQPAVTQAVQRLETELGERLLDRDGRDLVLTDAGQTVVEFATRFENLERDLELSLAELRDHRAGRLVIGANESTALYLIGHLLAYRRLFPRIQVQVRRCLSSRIPAQLLTGDLELGVVSYEPVDDRLTGREIYRDRLVFVTPPGHRFAKRSSVPIAELGLETFIAHNVPSPYRDMVLNAFQAHRVPLNIEVEMPTVETIKLLVQNGEGVAFLPRRCVELELQRRVLCALRVEELDVERPIRLIYPARRQLSHAARAFMDLVGSPALTE